jgi:hypothetical protein
MGSTIASGKQPQKTIENGHSLFGYKPRKIAWLDFP